MQIPASYLFKTIYVERWEKPSPVSQEQPGMPSGPGSTRLALQWLGEAFRHLSLRLLGKHASPAGLCPSQGPAFDF